MKDPKCNVVYINRIRYLREIQTGCKVKFGVADGCVVHAYSCDCQEFPAYEGEVEKRISK